jgi:hypothetical protein
LKLFRGKRLGSQSVPFAFVQIATHPQSNSAHSC